MIENIFGNMIEITLSVSIVIALLLILSKSLDKNYTAKWRYWVWLVLAIRLILPFNITVSDPPIHLSAPETIKHTVAVNNVQNFPISEEADKVTERVEDNFASPMVENPHNRTSITDTYSFNIERFLAILWIAGIIIFLTYQLTIYFLYRKNIKPWCRDVKEQELLRTYENIRKEIKVIKKVPIMTCKRIKSPMVMGFWNPVLLLPDAAFPPQNLKMILRHELIHVKRKDVLYKTLILLARAVHWFNPFVHIMAMEANKDVELSCDAAVTENQNVDYRKAYSEAILSGIHKGSTSKAVFSTYFGGGKKMLKKRFTSLFDLRRKRKGIISMLLIVVILGILGLCISCTHNTDTETRNNKDNIAAENADTKTENVTMFKSNALGFSLEFPKGWEDRFIIEESKNSIDVFSKKVYEKYNGAGLLFTIVRVTGELITEEDMGQEPVRQQIVLWGNGYTYFTRMPSDMQYPPDDEEASSDYIAMSGQIANVSHWISLLGVQKPKAENEGFKVVGSSFFTVEIPNDWELKALEDFPLCWNIYAGNNGVGGIDLIPYKSEGLNEKSAANDNMMREYLFNDKAFRKVLITLNSEDAGQGTMEKIKNSFEFADGPFNVVDLQSTAEEYLARGGKKVFGKIENFEKENGKPVAIRVKVMEFIPDGPDDENPNGFHINDLNHTETYSLEFGVHVAPLVAPNYNTYGIYEIPLLDETFIKKYENYKDFFYDFIIGSDGQLKIVLGHYVP